LLLYRTREPAFEGINCRVCVCFFCHPVNSRWASPGDTIFRDYKNVRTADADRQVYTVRSPQPPPFRSVYRSPSFIPNTFRSFCALSVHPCHGRPPSSSGTVSTFVRIVCVPLIRVLPNSFFCFSLLPVHRLLPDISLRFSVFFGCGPCLAASCIIPIRYSLW